MKLEYEIPDVKIITLNLSGCILGTSGGDDDPIWG